MQALSLSSWLTALQDLCRFIQAWHEAIAAPQDARPSVDIRVIAAQQILAADPRMGPVPYARLSERTGLSQVHLDRLCREYLGHSPKAELDRLCLERVMRRLADPQRPLKAIALDLGFTDSSHLCRWFRKRSGQSPERYRAMPLT
jgi:AraC-like DNA-binding protein